MAPGEGARKDRSFVMKERKAARLAVRQIGRQRSPGRRRGWMGLVYVSPFIVGLLVFQLYPILSSLWYSLNDYGIVGEMKFIGLDHYRYALTQDPDFWMSLRITAVYVLLAVPLKLAFALAVALLMNVKIKGINFFRTVFYLPSILGGSVAISIVWRFIFRHDGPINMMLGLFHIPPVDWLSSPTTALSTIMVLTVWQFGSSMVLFLAGLKQVPGDLYEAGMIDGASKFTLFFKITLPMISPIIFFNLIMQMITAFQEFSSVFIITQGGPLKSTYLYGLMLYNNAFKHWKMGYASALSWILFVLIILLTLLVFRSSSKWVYYDDESDR